MGKNKSDDVKNKTDTKKSSINPGYEKTPAYTKSLASIVGSAAPKVNDFKEDYKKPESSVKVCYISKYINVLVAFTLYLFTFSALFFSHFPINGLAF